MRHEIKCWPQYFCRVADGSKTFEVRENDRGYQPGDQVLMREWNPETHMVYDGVTGEYREVKGYTGRRVKFRIGYVYPLDEKRVVFSVIGMEIL